MLLAGDHEKKQMRFDFCKISSNRTGSFSIELKYIHANKFLGPPLAAMLRPMPRLEGWAIRAGTPVCGGTWSSSDLCVYVVEFFLQLAAIFSSSYSAIVIPYTNGA